MFEKQYDCSYVFPEHACSLEPRLRALLSVRCGAPRRLWARLCLVSERDVRARRLLRSHAAFAREARRHYANHKYTVHPYSMLRLYWEMYLTLCYLAQTIVTPVQYAQFHGHYWWTVIPLDLSSIIDMTLNFFTGYIIGSVSKETVLDLALIPGHYLRGDFIFDFLALMSLVRLVQENVRTQVIFTAMKIFRIRTMLKYFSNILEAENVGPVASTLSKVVMLSVVYVHYNVLLQFLVEYMFEDSFAPKEPFECSWMTLAGLWNETMLTRYVFALDRSVAMLRQNTNMNPTKMNICDGNFTMISWIISKYLYYHCLFMIMVMTISAESSESKYYRMTRQVKTFARRRRLPERFERRIVEYYGIRFNSAFFVESHILNCVSGQLREDIILHSTRQLVKNVPFLKHLPRPLLVHLALRIRLEVFLAGDVILRVNTPGDCLYFIDKGMVAVYSRSGCEVCHLEDGDYFGEVAIVIKPHVRTASVVAVTSCELFRLEREDFEYSVAAYPDVLARVRQVAAARVERTAVLDEQHRAHRATIEVGHGKLVERRVCGGMLAASVMRPHVRTASVVAVASCELFRLEREYFEYSVAAYPDVLAQHK